mmetsp:Transcript_37029/g.80924  ORF Transcript_37029/g.80924 Transcript_37029/m.80924 type:complete len:234 (+) Transcript_37029:165-866(+)
MVQLLPGPGSGHSLQCPCKCRFNLVQGLFGVHDSKALCSKNLFWCSSLLEGSTDHGSAKVAELPSTHHRSWLRTHPTSRLCPIYTTGGCCRLGGWTGRRRAGSPGRRGRAPSSLARWSRGLPAGWPIGATCLPLHNVGDQRVHSRSLKAFVNPASGRLSRQCNPCISSLGHTDQLLDFGSKQRVSRLLGRRGGGHRSLRRGTAHLRCRPAGTGRSSCLPPTLYILLHNHKSFL